MIATINELKDAKRLVEKAKHDPITLNFTRLGTKENFIQTLVLTTRMRS